jgi:hypothetical protein
MGKITHYKGKPIESLSREELIEALNGATHDIQRLMEEKKQERDFFAIKPAPIEDFIRDLKKNLGDED